MRYTHSHAPRPPGAESMCAIHILMPQDHPEQKACVLYTFSCPKTTRSRKHVSYTHSHASRPPGAESVCAIHILVPQDHPEQKACVCIVSALLLVVCPLYTAVNRPVHIRKGHRYVLTYTSCFYRCLLV